MRGEREALFCGVLFLWVERIEMLEKLEKLEKA